MLSFGDFKKHEINKVIRNKDPLGLNTDINMSVNNPDTAVNNSDIAIESYMTIKTNMDDEAILPKTKMAHNAIPHYLRAGNLNNSADTSTKEENNSPTLQVNSKSLRSTRSVSGGN